MHLCGRNYFLRSFAPDNGIKAYSSARQLQLTLNGIAGETICNGGYHIPDAEMRQGNRVSKVPGIPVDNVFFWKTPLQAGRNVVEVSDGKGHSDRMIVYITSLLVRPCSENCDEIGNASAPRVFIPVKAIWNEATMGRPALSIYCLPCSPWVLALRPERRWGRSLRCVKPSLWASIRIRIKGLPRRR